MTNFSKTEEYVLKKLKKNDSLSGLAYSRMRTEECRLKLKNFLIEIQESRDGWPIAEVENTCFQLFGEDLF